MWFSIVLELAQVRSLIFAQQSRYLPQNRNPVFAPEQLLINTDFDLDCWLVSNSMAKFSLSCGQPFD